MSKLVVMTFRGELAQGFDVSLEIGQLGSRAHINEVGHLPPPPQDLNAQVKRWRSDYRKLINQSRALRPTGIEVDGTLANSRDRFQKQSEQLVKDFNQWLTTSDEFQPIQTCLHINLDPTETIQVLLSTGDPSLHELPWHQWAFIQQYSQAEIAFSPLTSQRQPQRGTRRGAIQQKAVNILAVLGHSEGIELDIDKALLRQLPDANVHFLNPCDRKNLSRKLHSQSWQILFFAGHSETTKHSETKEKGIIHLNDHESLSLQDLRTGLQKAIVRGLQVAIFNSCDGLGIARNLSTLNIPTMIVMQEEIPNQVAQLFLEFFLEQLSLGESFFNAVRNARGQLEGIEDKFPCASWLPVIWQNPTSNTFTWPVSTESTYTHSIAVPLSRTKSDDQIKQPHKLVKGRKSWRSFAMVFAISVLASGLVIGIQSLGWLQSSELAAYNRLMQTRPIEAADPRLLIVGADEGDLDEYTDGNGSLIRDEILAELLSIISRHEPKAIGLDIFRPQPVNPGHEKLSEQLSQNNNIIVPCFFSASNVENAISPPLASSEDSIGFVDLYNDDDINSSDPTLRRYLLSKSSNPIEQPSKCESDYSFALLLIDKYLQTTGEEVTTNENEENWMFRTLVVPPLNSQSGGYEKFDARGYQTLINYRKTSNPRTIAQQINFRSILNGEKNFDARWIKDRVVIIGITAPSRHDEHHTPFGNISGPLIHAHVVSQFLSALEDNRPLISWWPQRVEHLWILWWSILTGSLIYLFQQPIYRGCIFFSVIFITWLSSSLLFNHLGIWVPVIPVPLACLVSSILILFTVERRR